MGFHDMVAADSAILFAEDGPSEVVTYTPSSGTGVSIRALVERGESTVPEGGLGGGRRMIQCGVLVVSRDDVPAIVEGEDVVTIDGEAWRVTARKASDAATATLTIERAVAGAVRAAARVGR